MEGTKVTSIACGWRHTLVVTDQGSVYAWGRATNGQLGFPSDRDVYDSPFSVLKQRVEFRLFASDQVDTGVHPYCSAFQL